jgi:hypothetical protein
MKMASNINTLRHRLSGFLRGEGLTTTTVNEPAEGHEMDNLDEFGLPRPWISTTGGPVVDGGREGLCAKSTRKWDALKKFLAEQTGEESRAKMSTKFETFKGCLALILQAIVMVFYAPGTTIVEMKKKLSSLISLGLGIASISAGALAVVFLSYTNVNGNLPRRVEATRATYMLSIALGVLAAILSNLSTNQMEGGTDLNIFDKICYGLCSILVCTSAVLNWVALTIWIFSEAEGSYRSWVSASVLWFLVFCGLVLVCAACKFLTTKSKPKRTGTLTSLP